MIPAVLDDEGKGHHPVIATAADGRAVYDVSNLNSEVKPALSF